MCIRDSCELDLQAKIWVRLKKDTQVASAFGEFEEHKAGERIQTTIGRITFNAVLPDDYPFLNYEMNKTEISRLVEDCCNRYKTCLLYTSFRARGRRRPAHLYSHLRIRDRRTRYQARP